MLMIRKAEAGGSDSLAAAQLLGKMWRSHSVEELAQELEESAGSPDGAVFLALKDGKPAAVAQCALRRDYVEGTDSSPVGYLEGIYVEKDERGKGLARLLCAQCEDWAREKGCCEFASDCELTNTNSLKFHLRVGFAEANRIICFTKKL